MTVMKGIRNLSSDARGNKQVFPLLTNNLIVDVEKFHSFREVHTPDWHRRRHEVAQTFLDQFMRKVCLSIDYTDNRILLISMKSPGRNTKFPSSSPPQNEQSTSN